LCHHHPVLFAARQLSCHRRAVPPDCLSRPSTRRPVPPPATDSRLRAARLLCLPVFRLLRRRLFSFLRDIMNETASTDVHKQTRSIICRPSSPGGVYNELAVISREPTRSAGSRRSATARPPAKLVDKYALRNPRSVGRCSRLQLFLSSYFG